MRKSALRLRAGRGTAGWVVVWSGAGPFSLIRCCLNGAVLGLGIVVAAGGLRALMVTPDGPELLALISSSGEAVVLDGGAAFACKFLST